MGSVDLGGTATGAFVSGAAAITLEVRLDQVEVLYWINQWGGDGRSGFGPGTRIVAGEPGTAAELQLGKCNDEKLCQGSWNSNTGRYEAADHSNRYLVNDGSIKSDWAQTVQTLRSKGFCKRCPIAELPFSWRATTYPSTCSGRRSSCSTWNHSRHDS